MNEMNNTHHLRLYLIRHGEVEGATAGKLFGRTDAPLSTRGWEQSRQIAAKLQSAQLCAIYSSDLQRAVSMAETIAAFSTLTVQPNSEWREIDMGKWEGRTIAMLYDETPELVAQLFDDPASFEYPGGESFAAFAARVAAALDQLLKAHKTGEVALVAHGGVCRAIIGAVLGMPMRTWLRLAQEYGCLNIIDWHDAHPIVESLNLKCEV